MRSCAEFETGRNSETPKRSPSRILRNSKQGSYLACTINTQCLNCSCFVLSLQVETVLVRRYATEWGRVDTLFEVIIGTCAMALMGVIFLVPISHVRGVAVSIGFFLLLSFTSPAVPGWFRHTAILVTVAMLVIAVLRAKPILHPNRSSLRLVSAWYFFLIVTTLVGNADDIGLLISLAAVAISAATIASRFTPSDLQMLLRGIVGVALLEVCLGVIEMITKKPIPWGYGVYSNGLEVQLPNPFLGDLMVRVEGSTGHPIVFGVVMLIALCIVMLTPAISSIFWRIILTLVFTLGFVVSGTRIALVAAALVAGYRIATSRNGGRWRGIGVGIAVTVAGFVFSTEVGEKVSDLVGSGSFTNRLGAIKSIPGLMERGLFEVFSGNGYGSEAQLFESGYLQQNGFGIIDNQFVTTLAIGGVFGLLGLIGVLVAGFRNSDGLVRALMIVMIVMMFSFDYLRWPVMVLLFGTFVSLPTIWTAKGGLDNRRVQRAGALSVSGNRVFAQNW